MSGLILCSRKSDIPYKIPDASINIYSIEELSYYLYNNAYFLDENFFSDELIDYIEKNLKLSKTAKKLRDGMLMKQNFAELVIYVLSSSMYYKEAEIKGFEKELKAIGSKSMLEKMMARANMLYKNEKYITAKKTYKNILKNKMHEKQDDSFYSDVYTGLGKIYLKTFYFEKALLAFEKAYELNKIETTLKNLINAKLLNAFDKGEGADFNKENELFPGIVFRVKEEFKDTYEKICASEEYEKNDGIFRYDGRKNVDDYFENIYNTLEKWKEDYRNYLS